MNKVVHLGLSLSILEISKIVMYEFWYDYCMFRYSFLVNDSTLASDNAFYSRKNFLERI